MNTDIINDSISDKLIEIAKHPELRNEYQIRFLCYIPNILTIFLRFMLRFYILDCKVACS